MNGHSTSPTTPAATTREEELAAIFRLSTQVTDLRAHGTWNECRPDWTFRIREKTTRPMSTCNLMRYGLT